MPAEMPAAAASGGNPILGIVVILVVAAVLMYTVYKGLDCMIACCIAACLVALGCGLNVYETMMGTFWDNALNIVANMGFCLLLSILLGQIYLRSGAADSIGMLFERLFVRNTTDPLKVKTRTAFTFYGVLLVLCLCGMNAYVASFCLIPMGFSMFKKADMPRSQVPGMLASALSIAACCPGTPLYTNVLASSFFGTTSTAALIPGLCGVLAMLILGLVWIRSFVRKNHSRGLGYVEPAADGMGAPPAPPADRKLPNPYLALIPLVLNVVFYGFVGWAIEPTLLLTIVISLIFFFPYFKAPDERLSVRPFNSLMAMTTVAACPVILMMAAQMGYAGVVSDTSSFGMMIGVFQSIPLPSHIGFGIFAALSGFLCGDSIAGLAMSSGVYLSQAEAIGMSAEAMHRIALFAVSILDTIPICGGVIAMLKAANMTHKEGYGPIFRTSVVYPFVGMVVCILVCMIVPAFH